MKFDKQVVIVTGGGRGIGQAIAAQFCQEGASVGVLDVLTDAAQAVAKQLQTSGGTAMALPVDVRDAVAVQAAVAQVVERWGKLNVLVNNAAIGPVIPFLELDEATWDAILDVNLKGMWLCTKAAVPHLHRSEGAVVNVSSVLALRGAPGNCAYAASKAGVLGMTRTMAVELAERGIRVNAVVPGSTDTAMMWGDLSPSDRAQLGAHVTNRLPLGRIAMPDEIARVVLFLASREASFVTGATYPVDGGHLARSSVY